MLLFSFARGWRYCATHTLPAWWGRLDIMGVGLMHSFCLSFCLSIMITIMTGTLTLIFHAHHKGKIGGRAGAAPSPIPRWVGYCHTASNSPTKRFRAWANIATPAGTVVTIILNFSLLTAREREMKTTRPARPVRLCFCCRSRAVSHVSSWAILMSSLYPEFLSKMFEISQICDSASSSSSSSSRYDTFLT